VTTQLRRGVTRAIIVGVAGRVFPEDGPRTTASQAEKRLWTALKKQLPTGWVAWHSLRVHAGPGWEGEGDFVIAAPSRGLLILEVKGGQIELQGGRWMQNGKPLKLSPRDQGQRFARTLLHALRIRNTESPPFGVACAFPDVAFSDAPAADGLDGAVIGERELSWLAESLTSLFDRVVPVRPMPHAQDWMSVLHELWGHTWVPRVNLADRIEDSSQRLLGLEQEQLLILKVVGENRTALVEGGAGSGKTVIAHELCARAARDGQTALFLCFTAALARSIDRSFAALRKEGHRVYATTVRGLAERCLRDARVETTTAHSETAWRDNLMRASDLILKRLTPAPEPILPQGSAPTPPQQDDALTLEALPADLVVVDEAQDLTEEDAFFVQALADGRKLWVFRDQAQGFWSNRGVPDELFKNAARLRLIQQHRNPAPVYKFAALYRDPVSIEAEGRTMDERLSRVTRDADHLRLSLAPTNAEKDLQERVRHEVERLRAEKIKAHDIAIVSLRGLEASAVCKLDRIGTHPVRKADADDAHEHIVVDTFLRIKGLERPVVIVVELPHESSRYAIRMHIALTRATTQAIIVCGPASLEADARLNWLNA